MGMQSFTKIIEDVVPGSPTALMLQRDSRSLGGGLSEGYLAKWLGWELHPDGAKYDLRDPVTRETVEVKNFNLHSSTAGITLASSKDRGGSRDKAQAPVADVDKFVLIDGTHFPSMTCYIIRRSELHLLPFSRTRPADISISRFRALVASGAFTEVTV